MNGHCHRRFLAGLTLVETMISIAILVFGMGGLSLLFLRSFQTNRYVLETGIASANASRIVHETVADLRRVQTADNGDHPIESGEDFDLEVYIDIDGDDDVERVHYFLDGTDFKRGVTEPTETVPVTYPAGDDSVETIAGDISNEADEPVFFYYDQNYPGDLVNNPMTTPIVVADVASVKVRLIVNVDPLHAPQYTTIESMAQFRNINIYAP